VIAGDAARVDHHRGVDRVERLDDPRRRHRALNPLGEAVGRVGEHRRSPAREVERVGHVDHELAIEVLRAGRDGIDRTGTGGAVEHHLAVRGGVGKGDLAFARRARAHLHVMAEVAELARDRLADPPRSKHRNPHRFPSFA